jgi:hypothetical protein
MQEQVSRKQDIYTLIGNQSKFLKSKIIEYENKIYTNVAVALGYYKCATGRSVYTVHVQHYKRESRHAGSRQALNIFALHHSVGRT